MFFWLATNLLRYSTVFIIQPPQMCLAAKELVIAPYKNTKVIIFPRLSLPHAKDHEERITLLREREPLLTLRNAITGKQNSINHAEYVY